jgi:hypothetical protein
VVTKDGRSTPENVEAAVVVVIGLADVWDDSVAAGMLVDGLEVAGVEAATDAGGGVCTDVVGAITASGDELASLLNSLLVPQESSTVTPTSRQVLFTYFAVAVINSQNRGLHRRTLEQLPSRSVTEHLNAAQQTRKLVKDVFSQTHRASRLQEGSISAAHACWTS